MRNEILEGRIPILMKRRQKGSTPDIRQRMGVLQFGPEDLHLIDDHDNWASPTNRERLKGRLKYEPIKPGHYWGDVEGLADLQDRINRGWHEGSDRCLALADRIRDLVPVPVGPRRRLRWRDQGDEVRMDRVYTGELDRAWRSMPRTRGPGQRIISIDVDAGHNAHVNAEDLFWAGASAVALSDALEDAGYRVELFSTSATSYGYDTDNATSLTRLRVKAADEPMNVNLVAALLALPATFRWYHLHASARLPWSVGAGWGTASYIEEPLATAVERGTIEGAEMILPMTLSEDEAVRVLGELLKNLETDQYEAEGVMV